MVGVNRAAGGTMSERRALRRPPVWGPVVALLLVGVVQAAAAAVFFQQLGEPPLVQFTVETKNRLELKPLHEGYGLAPVVHIVEFSIRPAPKDDVTVPLKFEGGAVRGVDFNAPEAVVFPGGANTQSVELAVLSDKSPEDVEKAVWVLQEAAGWRVGGRNILSVAIADPPDLPQPASIEFAPAGTVHEGSSSSPSVAVKLPVESPIERTFELAVSGTATPKVDHSLDKHFQVRVKKGQAVGSRSFSITDDDEVEGDETILVTLVGDDQLRSELIIVEDDGVPVKVRVRFDREQVEEGDAASLIAEFERVLKEDLHINLKSVGAATGGGRPGEGDFLLEEGKQLTIPAGSSSARVDLPVFADKLYEGDELLQISCSSSQHAAFSQGQVASTKIIDGDPRPKLVFAKPILEVMEAAGQASVSVRLDGAESVIPISFEYRAEPPADKAWPAAAERADYEFPPGRATIPAGEKTVDLPLKLIDDKLREPNTPRFGPPRQGNNRVFEALRITVSQDGEVQDSLPVRIEDDDYWHGDFMLLAPVTTELVAEPDRMKQELEAVLNSADAQRLASGAPWLVFPDKPSAEPWLPVRNEDGRVELDAARLDDAPCFNTHGGQGSLELRSAVQRAAVVGRRLPAGQRRADAVRHSAAGPDRRQPNSRL